jgi:hypothetical protein
MHPGCSFKYSQTAAHAQAELGVSRQAANAAKGTSKKLSWVLMFLARTLFRCPARWLKDS